MGGLALWNAGWPILTFVEFWLHGPGWEMLRFGG